MPTQEYAIPMSLLWVCQQGLARSIDSPVCPGRPGGPYARLRFFPRRLNQDARYALRANGYAYCARSRSWAPRGDHA